MTDFASSDLSIENAQVLLNEGMLEQAKDVLLALKVKYPQSSQVEELLHTLHRQELSQIADRRSPADQASGDDVLRIVERLVTDLELPLVQGIAADPEACRQIVKDLEREHLLGDRERVDLAIGFLEMGLGPVAELLLSGVTDRPLKIASVCLRAESLLGRKRPFDAVLALEEVLRLDQASVVERCSILYLLGRAYEAMGERSLAADWYQSVRELDPTFRDVVERIKC